jgi:hypothetical protein
MSAKKNRNEILNGIEKLKQKWKRTTIE